MPVTLINVFTVHKGKEEEFVKWWHEVKADITKRPGFISGKFYRSLKPDSRYNFINVAIWENEDLYWKAFKESVTHEKLKQLTAEMTPASDSASSVGRRRNERPRSRVLDSL